VLKAFLCKLNVSNKVYKKLTIEKVIHVLISVIMHVKKLMEKSNYTLYNKMYVIF